MRDWIILPGEIGLSATEREARRREHFARACEAFGCTIEDLLGRSRLKKISGARKAVMAALRKDGWLLNEIGEALGGRDRTTVMDGVKPRVRRVVPYEPIKPSDALLAALRRSHPHIPTACGKQTCAFDDECVAPSRNISRLESAQPMERV